MTGEFNDEMAKSAGSAAAPFDPKQIEIVGGNVNNLWVSLDYDTDSTQPYPVFLFTPSMADTNKHHHIEMTNEQARSLRDWLNKNVG